MHCLVDDALGFWLGVFCAFAVLALVRVGAMIFSLADRGACLLQPARGHVYHCFGKVSGLG
jgi:hypothetical protein